MFFVCFVVFKSRSRVNLKGKVNFEPRVCVMVRVKFVITLKFMVQVRDSFKVSFWSYTRFSVKISTGESIVFVLGLGLMLELGLRIILGFT